MKLSLLLVAASTLAFVAAGPAWADGDADAGKTLAKKCSTCHGANGEGKKKNPPLAGMAAADFVQAMQDYRSGTRENKTMNRSAKKLSDEDIANLAAYYTSL